MPVNRRLIPGRDMEVRGYNGSCPGPTIQVNEGDTSAGELKEMARPQRYSSWRNVGTWFSHLDLINDGSVIGMHPHLQRACHCCEVAFHGPWPHSLIRL